MDEFLLKCNFLTRLLLGGMHFFTMSEILRGCEWNFWRCDAREVAKEWMKFELKRKCYELKIKDIEEELRNLSSKTVLSTKRRAKSEATQDLKNIAQVV